MLPMSFYLRPFFFVFFLFLRHTSLSGIPDFPSPVTLTSLAAYPEATILPANTLQNPTAVARRSPRLTAPS